VRFARSFGQPAALCAGIDPSSRTQALLLLAMVLGLQLAVLGLLGEAILRIYHLAQGQPLYVVREGGEVEVRQTRIIHGPSSRESRGFHK
jgi:hypothetical protein